MVKLGFKVLYINIIKAFPTSYTEYYSPYEALNDIDKIETLTKILLWHAIFKPNEHNILSLKLFHLNKPLFYRMYYLFLKIWVYAS